MKYTVSQQWDRRWQHCTDPSEKKTSLMKMTVILTTTSPGDNPHPPDNNTTVEFTE